MNLRVYWVPTAAEGAAVQTALADQAIHAHLAARQHNQYLAVRSDRTDLTELISNLSPRSTPINLEHVPAPQPGEQPLIP